MSGPTACLVLLRERKKFPENLLCDVWEHHLSIKGSWPIAEAGSREVEVLMEERTSG